MRVVSSVVSFVDSCVRTFEYLSRVLVLGLRVTVVLVVVAGVSVAVWEGRTSTIQARVFADEATHMTFETAPGPSPSIRFPRHGPFDKRRGYSRLPDFLKRLTSAGYEIDAQARFSPPLHRATKLGISPPYAEKPQAGLRIVDRKGDTVFDTRHPMRIYRDFSEIPPLIVSTLLFIENRELLDMRYPKRNPTVEWDRLALAVLQFMRGRQGPEGRSAGGSTLATQIEKIRHSPGGWTNSPREKLRQMLSASLRVYRGGEETADARKRLVVDYLNSLPLAAVEGHGEVIGLADGLRSWFGTDFETVNKLLRRGLYDTPIADRPAHARAYKQVLSLLIAQRRPGHFLIDSPDALSKLTNTYAKLLARSGMFSRNTERHVLESRLTLNAERESSTLEAEDWEPDAGDIVRAPLVARLGLPGFYQLDRLDLTVQSSLDQASQQRVTQLLRGIGTIERAKSMALVGPRMLGRGDPAKVEYSFTLYERGEGVNWLRLQASNRDQPFNLSDGARLDLGSTAKLRTLATYLQIMATLHRRYGGARRAAARKTPVAPSDRLTRWAVARLDKTPAMPLDAFLAAALDRRYSASPHEMFHTGGGLHAFRNFDRKDNGQTPMVRDAFRRSTNLVFVRLMRDVMRYYRAQLPDYAPGMFRDVKHPKRRVYLERFAHHDGRARLSRLYNIYAGKPADEALARLTRRARTPRRVAAILRFVRPSHSIDAFGSALRVYAPKAILRAPRVRRLYDTLSPDRYELADISHIARLHPLELWLAGYLVRRPKATLSDALRDSATARVDAQRWLFRGRSTRAQNIRIQTMMEIEAFKHIARDWQRLGYPFDLVPSYATALGSSADRPAALAELLGIIVNGGIRRPAHRMTRLHFAQGTPYETVLVPKKHRSERVMPAEVARAIRGLLVATVERGTAKRAHGALRDRNGRPVEIGGKTGTGDHRYKIFGRGVRLIGERVVSRSATFMFLIGDRFYGVVTAHVMGKDAADYNFTSGLAVQLFARLAPHLQPVVAPGGVNTVAKPAIARRANVKTDTRSGAIPLQSIMPPRTAHRRHNHPRARTPTPASHRRDDPAARPAASHRDFDKKPR